LAQEQGVVMAEESYRNPLFGRRVDRYIPPEIRQGIGALVAGADMLNPVSAYRDYISAAKRGETGEAAANLAGFVAPGVAGALASRLARPAVSAASQYSDDAARALMEMLSPTGAPEFREAPAVRETPPVSAGQGDIPPPPEVTPPMRRTLDEMRASARARIQEKNALVEQLTANEAPVRMSDGVLTALVSRSPDREGWRVTYFQPDGSPSGHSDAADKASAVRKALDDQFRPIRAAARSAENAPLPEPRTRAEEISDEIAELLRAGRVEEAEQLLGLADDLRLYQRYERGEVGMDLPMDFDSRMARAREMGFVRDEFHGTTVGSEMRAPRSDYGSGTRKNIGFVTSTNPYVSSSYADPNWGSVFPLLTRELPENALRFDARGENWNRLPGYESADIGGRSTGPISVRLANMGQAGMRGMYDTNQLSRLAFQEGLSGAEFRNLVDRGIHAPAPRGDEGREILKEFQRRASEPSTVTMRQDTRGVRSRFARFDPRFAGSRNLMAGVGGLGVMVGASEDQDEPAVRGYASGGPVRYGIGALFANL
jgi:hypothetical protein